MTDPTREREDSLSQIAVQVNKHRRRGVTGCSCGSWFALNGRSVDEQHAEHVAEFVLKSTAILGAQIAELEARREGLTAMGNYDWFHRAHSQGHLAWGTAEGFICEYCTLKTDLESQLSALKAKREGGAKK